VLTPKVFLVLNQRDSILAFERCFSVAIIPMSPANEFRLRRAMRVLADLGALTLAYLTAFILRFDGLPPAQMAKRMLFTLPYIVGFEFAILSAFRVTQINWRHVTLRDAVRVGRAVLVSSLLLLTWRLLAPVTAIPLPLVAYTIVPMGVIVVNALLACFLVLGVRGGWRLTLEAASQRERAKASPKMVHTLLIGAGAAGAMVAREIRARPDLGIKPVGFVDDEPGLRKTLVEGIEVKGPLEEIKAIAQAAHASQALVTIADLKKSVIQNIVTTCQAAGLVVKVLPNLGQILRGNVLSLDIKDVSIEDLLGRETVSLDQDLIQNFITDRCVVVTGAGGSIGSEICRQVAQFGPKKLCLVERSEFALFQIEQELGRHFPHLQIEPLLCDICDEPRVEHIFQTMQPEVIFHAAAHKHVPLMEQNPGEAIKNNVMGTALLGRLAKAAKVGKFVFISTDKAINPTSIMGASKRIAEMLLLGHAKESVTRFMVVRFGNVLGSAGSVIPIFKQQITSGGPVTVTHPEMRRYFMTIPEASQLVLQAGAMGQGGEIFVLDMGEPIKIVDLAHQLITLSGFSPGVDIKIEFTGMRPGEKLFEELGFAEERMSKTEHTKIFVGRMSTEKGTLDTTDLKELQDLRESTDRQRVREALRKLVPEMMEESPAA